MKRRVTLLAFASTVLAAAGAAGQEQAHFEAGFRTGYAVALGKVQDNPEIELNDGVKGQVPLWFDIGARTQHLFFGAYTQYGFAILKEDCDRAFGLGSFQVNFDCKMRDIRLGAQLHFHFLPDEDIDPWLGYGFGYEWLKGKGSLSGSLGDYDGSVSLRGFEFANFQGGVDFRVADSFAVGPFISVSLGKYSKFTTKCDPDSACNETTADIDDTADTALHEWLFFGLRGVFGS